MFCTREGIRKPDGKQCTSRKKAMVHAIVHAKLHPEACWVPKKLEVARRNAINRKRYMNVMFSKNVIGPLANRGKSLSKEELTAGKKTDEDLHKLICREYNNKKKHNENVFMVLGSTVDPSSFEGPIVWQQSAKALKDIAKDYEYCYSNWKKSVVLHTI